MGRAAEIALRAPVGIGMAKYILIGIEDASERAETNENPSRCEHVDVRLYKGSRCVNRCIVSVKWLLANYRRQP